jgi:hypothetical protein
VAEELVRPTSNDGVARVLRKIAARAEQAFTLQALGTSAPAPDGLCGDEIADDRGDTTAQLKALAEVEAAVQAEIDAADGRLNELRATEAEEAERTSRVRAIVTDAAVVSSSTSDTAAAVADAHDSLLEPADAKITTEGDAEEPADARITIEGDAEVIATLALAASLDAVASGVEAPGETCGGRKATMHEELVGYIERLGSFELWNERAMVKLKANRKELEARKDEDVSWQTLNPQVALLVLP